MSVVITLEDIQAYAEVDYIIHHMNQRYIDKVPSKMIEFFESYKDPNHEIHINPYVPLQNQGLKRYTLEIIALLHLKYWCEDEKRKQELYNIMLSNQHKLEEQMREKYSVEKLFDNASATVVTTEEDLEKQDFSKPRAVQRYEQYTQNNPDIQDYTDVVDEDVASRDGHQSQNLPTNESTNASGIFQRIKNKFLSIFSKTK